MESPQIQIIEWKMMDMSKYYPLNLANTFIIRGILYPLTVIKTRIQIQHQHSVYRGTIHAFLKISQTEGFKALYKGFWINSIQIVSGICYITTYEKVRDVLSVYGNVTNNKLKSLVGGACASVVGQTIVIPVDIISQHMMVLGQTVSANKSSKNIINPLGLDISRSKKSIAFDITKEIFRRDGIVGFYRGYWASLCAYVPNSALWWTLYSYYSDIFVSALPSTTPHLLIQCLAASAGGTTSVVFTNPLDCVRARMQVNRRGTITGTLRELWIEERFRLFSKGLMARVMQSAIFSSFIIVGYESVKRFSVLDEYKNNVRCLIGGYAGQSYRMCSSTNERFNSAKTKLNTLSEEPGNHIKLKIYALFKQATIGTCNVKKPGMLDIVGKAKWDAWNSLGTMSMEEAQKSYSDIVDELAGAEPAPEASAQSSSKYTCLDVSTVNKVTTIKFNRPHKKNAITFEMYNELVDALNEAANDDNSVATVTTGAGDFYCSGNDLGNFANVKPDKIKDMAVNGGITLRKFVSAFIDFPKPLIAAVNGPAVGISVTILGLYDAVWSRKSATFHTPFSSLGQSPEGCSSLTFPRIMGHSKAAEMIFFDRKISADVACERGLVSQVFSDSTFDDEVNAKLQEISKLPRKSLIYSKALTRDMDRELFHRVNDAECERLVERWQSEDCINAIMAFFQRKAK
ncbi:Enoyl-CoA delta isomerase 2, mitochondrial [Nymphon striatum]|nr:Enoyl-CoA delta isomerase 2, mitochondrial [Nymphon striatum]